MDHVLNHDTDVKTRLISSGGPPLSKKTVPSKRYRNTCEVCLGWRNSLMPHHDLGEGGLYAQTLLPPPVGIIIRVEFELPDGHPISVNGEVRHSLENTYGSLPAGFGVQFLDLTESDRQRIISLVESDD